MPVVCMGLAYRLLSGLRACICLCNRGILFVCWPSNGTLALLSVFVLLCVFSASCLARRCTGECQVSSQIESSFPVSLSD